ncbi:MAG TPA: HAMP domain-containing sensor histidine kinase [Pseudobdellovibrionaceae bacterium]|jgi:signal transduction histidine kinase
MGNNKMVFLEKFKKLLPFANGQVYLFSAVLWLFSCQIGFYFLQINLANKTLFSLQNQLRQELDFSNFQYLIRSITDFQNSGSIKCAVVKMKSPVTMDILDLRYMSGLNECAEFEWFLGGAHIRNELHSLNGDVYSFDFVSNNGIIFYFTTWSFRIFGILLIFLAYKNMLLHVQAESNRMEVEMAYAKELSQIASMVAHDIRSPLSVLNVLVSNVSGLNSEQKEIISAVVQRINSTADELLKKGRINYLKIPSTSQERKNINEQPKGVDTESCKIIPTIEGLIQEKKLEYQNNSLVQIQFRPTQVSKDLSVSLSSSLISRIVSNLINNSTEAIIDDGSIFIEVEKREQFILVMITDFGKGMSEAILDTLKSRPVSYGKNGSTSGNGIGIFSANEALKKIGGNLQIQSKLDVGTKVTLSLPLDNGSRI